jgi:twitching motility protein PilT
MPGNINALLRRAVEIGASDLHLKVGSFPMARVHGHLKPVTDDQKLNHDDLVEMAASVMPAAHRERFKDAQEV